MVAGDMNADAIRRRMREIRKELRTDVGEVVQGANQLFDWKSYVRRSPWLLVISAGVFGYLMIPSKFRNQDAVCTSESTTNTPELKTERQSNPRESTSAPSIGWNLVEPIVGGVMAQVGTVIGALLADQIIDAITPIKPESENNDATATVETY